MSSSDTVGSAADTANLTASLPPEAGARDAFCEVRTLGNVVVAQGLSGVPLAVPPGTYFVTAHDAEGTNFTAEAPVEVAARDWNTVQLAAAGFAAPRPPEPEMLGDLYDRYDLGYPVARQVALWPVSDPLLAFLARDGPAELQAGREREASVRTFEAQEQFRTSFCSPEVVEVEAAMSAGLPNRYRVPIPVDHFGATMLVIGRPRIGSRSRGRFELDLDLEFENPKLELFWRSITSAAFEEAWARSEAMAPDLVQTGADWMRDKLESPVGATLGAYVLLRANRLDLLETWSANFARWFPHNPDALVTRAEVLARLGEHRDAALLLSSLGQVGCPWIRSGIEYAFRLTNTYSEARGHHELHSLDDGTVARLEALCGALGRLNGNADPRRVNTVIYWHFPERKSAR